MIDKYNMLMVVAIFLITLGAFILGYQVKEIYPDLAKNNKIIIDGEENNCFEVYDITTASYCLRDWVKGFYNYTIRDERDYNNWGDIDDIKLNGGDCFDYTMLYKAYLDNNGYKTKKIDMPSHTFLMAWDKNITAYCTLDLLNVNCLKFIGSADYMGSGDYDEKIQTN